MRHTEVILQSWKNYKLCNKEKMNKGNTSNCGTKYQLSMVEIV